MTKEELLVYDAPWYTEYVSIDWMQTVIAWLLTKKVARKIRRYNYRKARERFFKNHPSFTL